MKNNKGVRGLGEQARAPAGAPGSAGGGRDLLFLLLLLVVVIS